MKMGYGVIGEESGRACVKQSAFDIRSDNRRYIHATFPTSITFDTTEAGPRRTETLSALKIAYFDPTNFQIVLADMHGGISE